MTYQGPQQPWQHPGQQPQYPGVPQGQPGFPPPAGQFGPPPGYGQQPGYPPGYPPPPKKKTGLIVGLVIGFVVLLGLGVGSIFLFTGNDEKPAAAPTAKPASKVDLAKLDSACQFLSPEELGAKTGAKGLRAEEVKKSQPDLTSFIVGCNYFLPDNRLLETILYRIYQPGTCDPQYCLDIKNFQDANLVEGVGQKALFFLNNELKRGELLTVDVFGDIPVLVTVVGPGRNITAEELGPLAEDILAKIGS